MANQRSWLRNNWEKLIEVVLLILAIGIGYGTIKADIKTKVNESQSRIIAEQEVKDHAPSKEKFTEVRMWIAEQTGNIRRINRDISEIKQSIRDALNRPKTSRRSDHETTHPNG